MRLGYARRTATQAALLVALLGLTLFVTGSGGALAAVIGAQAASGEPGATVQIPVVLSLGADTADRMGFSLEITPNGAAPPLTGNTTNLSFLAQDVPSPGMVTPTKYTIRCAWLSFVDPPITGTVLLGYVRAKIPSTAQPGHNWTVHMVSVGASLGDFELTTEAGPDVLLSVPGGGEAGGAITVSITLASLGVNVSPTNWALDTVAPESAKSSWATGVAGYFTATNTGNIAEDFTISTGATSHGWQPALGSGHDQYVIAYGVGVSPYTTPPSYTPFTVGGALADSVVPSGIVRFDLRFTAPSADSAYDPGGESFTVSIGATATS